VSHNYPNIVFACWRQVSTIVYGFLMVPTPEVYARPWKGHTGDTVGFIGDKVITAAVKVECLPHVWFSPPPPHTHNSHTQKYKR